MKELKSYSFFVDKGNKKALERQIALKKLLEIKKTNLVIVLGGDGTMLQAAHSHNFQPVFLGINCGHKGYLMNDDDEGEVIAKKISHDQFEIHQFPLLKIEGENWQGLAMNDIYFNRISGQACKVNLKIDGIEIAERISGDGIVVCTALGSTGYFTPIGGIPIHPKLSVIGFGPIARNVPFQILPLILPSESELEVTLLSPPEEVKGWHDGIEMPYFQKIRIKKSAQLVKLAFWTGENFTKRLITKIMKIPEVKNANY